MIIGITDRISELGPIEQEYANKGVNFIFFNTLNEREFPENMLAKVDVLLVWHAKVSDYTAIRLKRCQLVIRYGVGYDQIDGDALANQGIALANNPSYCIEEVADTAVAMILTITRNIGRHDSLSRFYHLDWQENSLRSLRSKSHSIGLIGLGKIGIATALRLRSFGFNIIGYDPYVCPGLEKSIGINRAKHLNEVLENGDVVSLHCPLTKETKGMVNTAFLRSMRDDAALVNTARGKILHSLDDLYNHLKNKPNFRVALDVLPNEPPNDHILIKAWRSRESWLNGRLLINPHQAYYSQNAAIDMRRDVLQTAWQALKHKCFQNIVNGVTRETQKKTYNKTENI